MSEEMVESVQSLQVLLAPWVNSFGVKSKQVLLKFL
jgi:hypothetical protein